MRPAQREKEAKHPKPLRLSEASDVSGTIMCIAYVSDRRVLGPTTISYSSRAAPMQIRHNGGSLRGAALWRSSSAWQACEGLLRCLGYACAAG